MSDVERVAAAMREANAELQVQPPDVSETVGYARRSLIRRLLVVGALSGLGATLLIAGGTAPAITHIRATRPTHNDQNTDKHGQDGNGNENNGGGGGTDGGKGSGHRKGDGGHHKHDERLEAAVGPGEPIEVPLPDLVVSHVTKTEVTVTNHSSVDTEPFTVSVIVEAKGQNTVTVTVPFEGGLEGEKEETKSFEPPCESGTISAEVDPANEIEESSEEDNVLTESPPVKCEPAEGKEEETEKEKTKETSGSTTGIVDSATSPTGGATAP